MTAIDLREYIIYQKEELIPLYEAVGWTNYTQRPKVLVDAYQNSLYSLGAYIENELVGIIRVVGDGVSVVLIQDLLVYPTYQRQGIGHALLAAVLAKYSQVRQKVLLTDNEPALKAFYAQSGLNPILEKNGICFVEYTFS